MYFCLIIRKNKADLYIALVKESLNKKSVKSDKNTIATEWLCCGKTGFVPILLASIEMKFGYCSVTTKMHELVDEIKANSRRPLLRQPSDSKCNFPPGSFNRTKRRKRLHNNS